MRKTLYFGSSIRIYGYFFAILDLQDILHWITSTVAVVLLSVFMAGEGLAAFSGGLYH